MWEEGEVELELELQLAGGVAQLDSAQLGLMNMKIHGEKIAATV